jgi:hypothetical protein
MSDYHYDENINKVDDAAKDLTNAIEKLVSVMIHVDPGISNEFMEKIERAAKLAVDARREIIR